MHVLPGEEPHFPSALSCVPLFVFDAELGEDWSALESLLPVHPKDLRKHAGFFLTGESANEKEDGHRLADVCHDG